MTEHSPVSSAAPRAPFLGARDRPLVLYLIEHRDASGAEVMQLPLLSADADPLVVCPQGGSTQALIERHGIPTVPMRFRTLRSSAGPLESLRSIGRGLAAARELRAVLRAHPERPIVCCATIRAGLMAALATLTMRRRLLWVVTDFLPPAPLRQMVRALAALRCSAAAPSSRALSLDFTGANRMLRRRTHVAYPGVDLERFHDRAGSPGAARAAIVGHISPTKQTHLAVEVARRVAAEQPAFRLEVAGRAQYRDADFAYERRLVASVARDPRLRDVVRFRGHAGDVAELLGRCGLLLHCRPDEPFGIVLIEAMAIGLPVVAPRSCGPAEIVDDQVTGFLYEPGDVEQAAAYVLQLIRDPREAARLGAAGRERVARLFSAERQVRSFDALLAGLAG